MFYFYHGWVALYALLRALDVGPGDEIILPAFTCLAVPSPIVGIGARPVYVDIEGSTYNVNPVLLEPKITTRTKAIIVQHTFDIPADMEGIAAIAQRHGLPIIEDCCHSLGSKWRGKELWYETNDNNGL